MAAKQDESSSVAKAINSTQTALNYIEIPSGQIFGAKYEICGRLDSGQHADVYRVKLVGSGPASDGFDLEARAFCMQNLSRSLHTYRKRSKKRLLQRSVLQTTWNELEVVIYQTGPIETVIQQPKSTKESSEATCEMPSAGGEMKRKKSKPKTAYQRESSRLRQRDRRHNRRVAQRNDRARDSSAEADETAEIDEETYTMFTILYIAHNPNPELLGMLPQGTRDVVETWLAYRQKKNFSFVDDKDMEAFLGVKETELSFLRRQEHKLPFALEQSRIQLALLLRKQYSLRKLPDEWNAMQNELVKPAKKRHEILTRALGLLPDLVKSAQGDIRSVKQSIPAAREHRIRSERKDLVSAECRRLRDKVDTLASSTRYMVPASPAYSQLSAQLTEVTTCLEQAEAERRILQEETNREVGDMGY